MWLQAKHLHTSAERSISPVASLSSPELLSDLFTCSPHAAQAKRMRGIIGEKMVRNRKRGGGREGGRGSDLGQVKRDRGERKEAISEKECSGDDNMLMMRGAGGKTHSVVIYRLTEPMKGWGERRELKMKATEIQDTYCAPVHRSQF